MDDFWWIDTSKERLRSAIEPIRVFLREMGMTLHPKKICLYPSTERVGFLGAVCAPYYRHTSDRTTKKFHEKLQVWEKGLENLSYMTDKRERERWLADCRACVNSYLGYLGHFKADGLVSRELSGSNLLEMFAVEKTDNARCGKIKCI